MLFRKQPKIIDWFYGDYYFLSNFYPNAPFVVSGIRFKTVEHWFQAHKATSKADFNEIINAPTPLEAKRIGRCVKLRNDWECVKDYIMYMGLFHKFTQNPEIGKKLVRTGNAYLIEKNNWHDNYWGVCICDECERKMGRNRLGVLLEWIREVIKLHI